MQVHDVSSLWLSYSAFWLRSTSDFLPCIKGSAGLESEIYNLIFLHRNADPIFLAYESLLRRLGNCTCLPSKGPKATLSLHRDRYLAFSHCIPYQHCQWNNHSIPSSPINRSFRLNVIGRSSHLNIIGFLPRCSGYGHLPRRLLSLHRW